MDEYINIFDFMNIMMLLFEFWKTFDSFTWLLTDIPINKAFPFDLTKAIRNCTEVTRFITKDTASLTCAFPRAILFTF